MATKDSWKVAIDGIYNMIQDPIRDADLQETLLDLVTPKAFMDMTDIARDIIVPARTLLLRFSQQKPTGLITTSSRIFVWNVEDEKAEDTFKQEIVHIHRWFRIWVYQPPQDWDWKKMSQWFNTYLLIVLGPVFDLLPENDNIYSNANTAAQVYYAGKSVIIDENEEGANEEVQRTRKVRDAYQKWENQLKERAELFYRGESLIK